MPIDLIIWDFDGVLVPISDDWAECDYPLTDGVREILTLPNLKHCIATNGTLEQTLEKVKLCGLTDIFNEQNIFTIDMAGVGKSSPDIFLLALQKMNEQPENTIVIDNSYTARKGAIKAGCVPISFLDCEHYENSYWIKRLKNIGIKHIFCCMENVKKLIKINRELYIQNSAPKLFNKLI